MLFDIGSLKYKLASKTTTKAKEFYGIASDFKFGGKLQHDVLFCYIQSKKLKF